MSACKHVYEIVNEEICSLCGRDTHETNWVRELEYRQSHVEKYGHGYQAPQVWWSI